MVRYIYNLLFQAAPYLKVKPIISLSLQVGFIKESKYDLYHLFMYNNKKGIIFEDPSVSNLPFPP